MRRALWEMPDNEIATLLDRAIMVLDELYVRAGVLEDQRLLYNQRLSSVKRGSQLWHKIDRERYFIIQEAGRVDQRIDAQETIVQALRTESMVRNPPFWTRHDLDRINRQR